MQRKLKTVVVSAVVGFLLFGTNLTQATAPTQISILSPEELTYDKAFNQWLDKLENQESGGKVDIEVLDTNGEYSRGCLQFQDATFNTYSQRFGVGGVWEDCVFQRKLARLMIDDSYSNWRHWQNSVLVYGVGKPPHR